MFTKMWCVALSLVVLLTGIGNAKTTESNSETLENVIANLGQDKDALKKALVSYGFNNLPAGNDELISLVEEIISIVKPHLSITEMDRVLKLLQVLVSKVRVQALVEIHRKLKASLAKFAVLAFLGVKKASQTTAAPRKEEASISLQESLQTILEKISLAKYEEFIKMHAGQISGIVCTTLVAELPAECITAITDLIATLQKLEHQDDIQAVLEKFVSGKGIVINTSR